VRRQPCQLPAQVFKLRFNFLIVSFQRTGGASSSIRFLILREFIFMRRRIAAERRERPSRLTLEINLWRFLFSRRPRGVKILDLRPILRVQFILRRFVKSASRFAIGATSLGVGNLFFVKYAATRSFAIVSLSIGSNLQAGEWGNCLGSYRREGPENKRRDEAGDTGFRQRYRGSCPSRTARLFE